MLMTAMSPLVRCQRMMAMRMTLMMRMWMKTCTETVTEIATKTDDSSFHIDAEDNA